MNTFENTVTIRRAPREVFAFLADFQNLPKWNYAIEQTVKVSPGPDGVGATYRQTRSLPRRGEEDFEVTVFDPPRRLAIYGQIGPFRARISYLLEAADGGTRLTNSVELEPPTALGLPARLAAPRIKAAVARNLGKLKLIMEEPATGDSAGLAGA